MLQKENRFCVERVVKKGDEKLISMELLQDLAKPFSGAIIALLLRELVVFCRARRKRKKLARLAKNHLSLLEKAFAQVRMDNERARYMFSETNFSELNCVQFVYDSLVGNIDLFDVGKLENTVKFFHGHKVQMANVRARLDRSEVLIPAGSPAEDGTQRTIAYATMTLKTFEGLQKELEKAIGELEGLSGFSRWWGAKSDGEDSSLAGVDGS